MKPQIDSIRIVRQVDENPDLSFIGEYGSVEKPGAIDREEQGDMGRHEYRYFYPPLWNYTGVSPRTQRKYAMQAYRRMEAYSRGDWCMVGVWCEATVSYPIGNGDHRLETLRSGGLWGIESDSGSDYLDEVAKDELADLKAHLDAFGVDTSTFDEKAAEAEETER